MWLLRCKFYAVDASCMQEQTTFGTAYSTPESETEYAGGWLVAANYVLLQLGLILITILIVLVLQFDDQFLWIQDSRDQYTKERLDSVIDQYTKRLDSVTTVLF
ncbi:hypothetical protein ZIOFF_036115 [Zingiber officinale]|uniref:Uncharacterized protein n=1 Tax=Zingiber officinale TaxID=94328 RepID=A0A8J5GDE3_ZINOF|nr:hypothetical protein ZIOFF_036115 [Zingiber officinale]